MQTDRIVRVLVLVVALALAFGAGYLAARGPGEGKEASGAADEDDWRFANPLLVQEEGEWAQYRLAGAQDMRLEFLGKDPVSQVVTMRDQRRDRGTDRILSSKTIRFSPNHFLFGFESSGGVIMAIYPDEIEVAGRDWPCLCVETVSRNTGPVKHWYSQEVPGTGLLRQERMGDIAVKVNAELVNWSGR